jgi:hypothetical protein
VASPVYDCWPSRSSAERSRRVDHSTRTVGTVALLALSANVGSFDLERALQDTASYINKTTPRPIGHGADLIGAVAYEKTLKYRFLFKNLEKSQFSSHFALKQTQFLTDFVCDKPELKVFVENGVTLKYAYHDKHGKEVAVITVDTRTCTTEQGTVE